MCSAGSTDETGLLAFSRDTNNFRKIFEEASRATHGPGASFSKGMSSGA